MPPFQKNKQYKKFCAYGFLKNLRFFDAFLLLFFLENGITFSQIGILYAVREIVINLAEIPSGIIADTYGRKNALVAAMGIYILSFFVFYFSSDFWLLFVAMLLYGVGEAFRSGTHKGMIMDYLRLHNWGDQKVAYYGHTRSWSQNGSALSALIAGIMVLYSGSYRVVYLFSVVPYMLNFVNILTYPDELNFSSSGKKRPPARPPGVVFKYFLRALKIRKVFQIINSTALHTAFLKAVKDYIQPVMIQVALLVPLMMAMDEKRKSGLIIGVLYFGIYLLTAYASRSAAKLKAVNLQNVDWLTLMAGLVAGLVCGLLVHLDWWTLSLVAFVLIYLVENLRKPILTGNLADEVPNEILTSVLSAQSFYRTVITAGLAIVIGFIADGWGLGIALLSISGILLLFVALIGFPER